MATQKINTIYTDADGFDAAVGAGDLVVVSITRDEVTNGSVGTVVERLMLLSDTKENAVRFCGRLSFSFGGWESDPRELYQIPEVVSYFREITRQWPFWLHFLEKHGDSIGLTVMLLNDVKPVFTKGGRRVAAIDPQALRTTLLKLFDGMNILYDNLGLDEALNRQVTAEVVAAIESRS